MKRGLRLLFALLAASVFAHAPAPKAFLPRTEMELRPGTRTLVATAQHSSRLFTTNTSATFTNNAVDQTTVNHFAEGQLSHRVWVNSLGQTNRVQTFTWDGRSRLIATTEVDDQNNGYNWSAVYDALGRRLKTTTVIVTNGVALTNQPKVIASYFDPNVEFLELGVNVSGKARWKVCGPDLNGSYGGMNGTGGFDGVVDDVNVVRPVVSDARGNVHGIFDTVELTMQWNGSRPTGYGAVPEHRPLSLSDNGDLGSVSAWRGRWPDRSGLYWLGARYYDPVAGRFISCDPYGHDADPSLYAFADGDPINRFDEDGRLAKGAFNYAYNGGAAGQALRGISSGLDYLSGQTDNPWLGGYAAYGSSLYGSLAGMSAPSSIVNGLTGFGNNVSTLYHDEDGGFLPAASYAISGWNVGKVWSGSANINLVTGEPVGDWYERGATISSGVASTAGVAAGGLGIYNWATASATAGAVPPVAGPGLVHLTDQAGATGIAQSGRIVGSRGIFAVPEYVAGESTAMRVARTGLTPGRTVEAVPIPQAAQGLFQQPVPIGPYSAWKYFGGVQYAPPGAISTATGAFTPAPSLIGPASLIYGPDVLFWGGVGAAAGISTYGGGGQ